MHQTLSNCGAIECGVSSSGEATGDPFVVASLGPPFAVHDTSLELLRRRFPDGHGVATLLAVASRAPGPANPASERAIEALVSYFQLAQPAAMSQSGRMRQRGMNIPGLRRGLQQALWLGRARVADALGGGQGVSIAVAYVAFPVAYVARIGPAACLLHRGEQLIHLTGRGERGVSHHRVKRLLERAMGLKGPGEVQRHLLRSGDRLLLSCDGLRDPALAADIDLVLRESVDAQTAAQALSGLATKPGHRAGRTVLVAEVSAQP